MRKHILLALFLGLVLLAAGSLAEGKIKVFVSSYTLENSERGSRSIFFPKELLISDYAHSGMGLTSQNQYRSILRLNW